MTDPAERFIEAAVRPLADNAELQMMAAQELRATIEGRPEGATGDSIDQAAENLEKGGLPRWFKVALYGLTALAAILVAIPLTRDYQHYRLATFTLFGMSDPDIVPLPGLPFGPDSARKTPAIFGKFSDADELLLFGDLSKPSGFTDHFKGLWDSDPTSAAYFAEYARACGSIGSSALPAKFLETADRLDPENAWFRCFAAGFAARDAVQENPAKRRIKKTGPPLPAIVVKDPAKLAEVVTLLEDASRMPRFDSYERELFLRRIAVLPPGDDTFGRLFVEKYLEMWPRRSRWIYRQIAQAVTVKCHELALAGDSPGFLKVAESWESFVRRSIENPGLPPDAPLWALSGFADAARELAISANTLGLAEKSGRYQRLADELNLRKIATNNRSGEARELLAHGGPDADRLLYPIARLENPPPLTEEDLRPGLLANSAKRERLQSAMMGAIILLAALHLAGLRFYRGPQVRRLSASLVKVLRAEDYAWILIGGVVLPVLVLVLTEPIEAKPPHGIDWELNLPRMVLQAGLLLMLPATIAIRRLDRRLGCIGWKVRGIPEPIAIGVVLIMVVASRFAAPQNMESKLWPVALFIMVPFAIIYPFLPLGASFCPRKTAVLWHTCCRALVPAHVLSVLLMALLVPLHHAREKYWTARNVLTKIEPGIPAMNRYEYEVENQVRKELLELFDAKP